MAIITEPGETSMMEGNSTVPGFCYEQNEETGLETESDFHSITHLFNNVYLALVLGQVLCWTLKTPCGISGATVLAGGPRHADESHSVDPGVQMNGEGESLGGWAGRCEGCSARKAREGQAHQMEVTA